MGRQYRPTTQAQEETERFRAGLVGGEVERFRTHLVNEEGLADSTAALYASITRKFLGEMQTLTPSMAQAAVYRDGLLRAGRGRAYVGNVVKALRRYSDFSGHDLRLPIPSRGGPVAPPHHRHPSWVRARKPRPGRR